MYFAMLVVVWAATLAKSSRVMDQFDHATADISNADIINNTARQGGGVYNSIGIALLKTSTKCTMTSNLKKHP